MKRAWIYVCIIMVLGIISCNILPSVFLTDEEIEKNDEEVTDLRPTQTLVVETPQTLIEELPEKLWLSIHSNFDFEPEVSQIMGRMSTDILALLPDHFNMRWFVFSHPGSVDEAFDDLFIAPGVETNPPYETPVDDILRLFLYIWEPEIKAARGAEWIAKAENKVLEWQGLVQTQADLNFLEEAYEGAVEAGIENEDPFITWTMTVTSPIVDLDELELIEGTYLIVSRFQYKD